MLGQEADVDALLKIDCGQQRIRRAEPAGLFVFCRCRSKNPLKLTNKIL